MKNEKILVVPRADILREDLQGFRKAEDPELRMLQVTETIREHGSYRPRPDMETDPTYKQIIPYIVIRDQDQVMHVTRTKMVGDQRLKGNKTIGFGGHLSLEDIDTPLPPDIESTVGQSIIGPGIAREIDEELDIKGRYTLKFLGELNDDSDEVGTVHYGLIFEMNLWSITSVAIKEKHKLDAMTWNNPVDLIDQLDEFESWSRIILRDYALELSS
jgi:predicted NUDIX family phosphoesterase